MRLEAHINRQKTFSKRTFGPGERLEGVLDHIRKELVEIEESKGKDIEEWVNPFLVPLLFTSDGHGHSERAPIDCGRYMERPFEALFIFT